VRNRGATRRIRVAGALRRGDRSEADGQAARLRALAARPPAADDDDANPQVVAILETELRAALRAADGASDEAFTLLRQAASIEDTMPVAFGPPDVVKPTHELLGELLRVVEMLGRVQRRIVDLPGVLRVDVDEALEVLVDEHDVRERAE